MSDPAVPPPGGYELAYQSVSEFRNAPLLVKLAGIFTLVSAGLSLLGAGLHAGMAIFMAYMFSHMPAPATGPGAPPFPTAIFSAVYGGLAVMALGACVVKVIGGVKLLRGGSGVWPWGLASGIVACFEFLWCSLAGVLPMAAGIYTIVILCMEHVQRYLRARAAGLGLPNSSESG